MQALVKVALVPAVVAFLTLLIPAGRALADDPPGPEIRLLVSQRIDLLPQGPNCWHVLRITQPAGVRAPATGYTTLPLIVGYQESGASTVEYAGGPTRSFGPGEGFFLGADNWLAITNPGTSVRTAVFFMMDCRTLPDGFPGISQVGNTGPLPGVQAASGAYRATLGLITGRPGSTGSTRTGAGPLTAYFTEGQVAVTLAGETKVYGPGSMAVIPPNTAYQTATVGGSIARALVLTLNPEGAVVPVQPVAPPAGGVRATGVLPTALPNTGDLPGVGWVVGSAALGGLVAASGFGLRRRRAVR